MYNIPHPGMILYIPLLPFDDPLPDFYQAEIRRNKKCHSHVTNAPKGIGQARDTFEES